MDRYNKLASNTIIMAIGTFSSKLLVFLLMPLYTNILSPAEYGVVDIIQQSANLLLPLVSVGMFSTVVRFGLDRNYRKTDVFTSAVKVIAFGFVGLLLIGPLLARIDKLSGYVVLVFLYVMMGCLRSVCSQFVRSQQYVRLYAIDGIFDTLLMILFNVLFLVVFHLGVTGYILAVVVSDFFSVLFLFFSARLRRFLRFREVDGAVTRAMLKYSIPMIPTSAFWWITNVSDRYMVAYLISDEANGLYAASYKWPTIVVLVSSIFMEAWQLSAMDDASDRERKRFFDQIFAAYQAVIFLAASGIILFAKVLTLFLAKSYYLSWQYVPVLCIATAFSCCVTFLGSIYMVEKKSVMAMLTTVVGALINVLLNLWLIPKLGVNGAAIATFASYFVVYWLRVIDTRRYIPIRTRPFKTMLGLAILAVQAWIMVAELPHWVWYEIGSFGVLFVLNIGHVWTTAKKLLRRRA